MSMHGFGIMKTAPVSGERFDVYEPEKYNCVSVNDDFIETVIHKLTGIKFFAHTVVFPINGLILITNKTIDKKSSHNPYTQDYARFFV